MGSEGERQVENSSNTDSAALAPSQEQQNSEINRSDIEVSSMPEEAQHPSEVNDEEEEGSEEQDGAASTTTIQASFIFIKCLP